jgi:arylsulfatase A-like enzyme
MHVLITMAVLLGLGCDPSPPVASTPSPALKSSPDVLVIVLDTVRADMLSTYGHKHPTSPQLDAVADAGVTFEDVTAPSSWTWPSHASLFTGTAPWEHGAHASMQEAGVGLVGGHWGLLEMRSDLPTMAEQFAAAGYRTVSVASNRFLDPKLGLTRGFQVAETMPDGKLAERIGAVLKEDDDRPLFMFVNILIAHAPWEVFPAYWSKPHGERLGDAKTAPSWAEGYLMDEPPGLDFYRLREGADRGGLRQLIAGDIVIPPEDMPLIEDLYTGGINAADFIMHRIVSQWTARSPEGIVAVTSDHGEYLGEHGLWDHGKTIFTEVINVPLVIAAPGRLPKGKRVSTPVQMQDLHDTVLALADIPGAHPNSLVGVVNGEPRPGPIQAKAWASRPWKETMGGVFNHNWSLYREGDLALIFSSNGDRYLYDLSVDPGMTKDLSASKPEALEDLWSRAEGAFPDSKSTTKGAEMSADMIEELKALGYLE